MESRREIKWHDTTRFTFSPFVYAYIENSCTDALYGPEFLGK
jgi:hypothetical protein